MLCIRVPIVTLHTHKKTYHLTCSIPPVVHFGWRHLASSIVESLKGRYFYHQTSSIMHTKSQNLNASSLVVQLSLSIHWSQVLSREWRWSWRSTDRRCSNKFIAYKAATYIRRLTVIVSIVHSNSRCQNICMKYMKKFVSSANEEMIIGLFLWHLLVWLFS